MKIWAIILLVLVLRVAWITTSNYKVPMTWEEGRKQSYNLTEYDKLNIDAVEISKGRWPHKETGEPLAWRPIGYPAFLGLLYFIFGVNYWVLYGSTLILQLLLMWILYLLSELLFNEDVGVVSLILYSIYPVSIMSSNMALDEHLFIPLFYGGIYLLIKKITIF